MTAIIDYKMGNLGSVRNAVEKMGGKPEIVTGPEEIRKFDRIILPGVGAFPDAMAHLKEVGMDKALKEFAESGKALMGTCLGMQLLFESSEEFGETKGLGFIPGKVVKFDTDKFDRKLKIPHMGWNELFVKKDTPIFEGLPREFYLYFVHSYHVITDEEYIIGSTYYGYEFTSAVQKDNIFGFQPHPEKSHDNGLKIIENFLKM